MRFTDSSLTSRHVRKVPTTEVVTPFTVACLPDHAVLWNYMVRLYRPVPSY